eukprot:CAMPEP_0115515138 /NCGR_PEP_ID=MMETSP0271-20121206/76051_1 /TAXON_ID=71861 /ORGANISM="Scrippsiella trochoidea, Strain CCMP3099" /LENGTH=104 /DNA_ID=CAMNT_0002945679 /DNA_START=69 /DNA_END=383 /DNA_ORIENTATION=-
MKIWKHIASGNVTHSNKMKKSARISQVNRNGLFGCNTHRSDAFANQFICSMDKSSRSSSSLTGTSTLIAFERCNVGEIAFASSELRKLLLFALSSSLTAKSSSS